MALNPTALLTSAMGSGRRLNVIRDWASLNLIPTFITVDGVQEVYNYARFVRLTEVDRISEARVKVYYTPAAVGIRLGCDGATWCRWADNTPVVHGKCPHMVPTPGVYTALRAGGLIEGKQRSRMRFMDFDLVAYFVSTKVEPWGRNGDIRLNAFKNILAGRGDVEVTYAAVPKEPDLADLFSQAQRDVGNMVPVTSATQALPSISSDLDDAFQGLEAAEGVVDLTQADLSDVDLSLLEARILTERKRRQELAVRTKWVGARIYDVTKDPETGEVLGLWVVPSGGAEVDAQHFRIG